MALPKKLLLRAKWGSRSETWPQVADRLWSTLGRLKKLGPLFAQPWIEVTTDAVISDSLAELEHAGAERFQSDDAVSLLSLIPQSDTQPDWTVAIDSSAGRSNLWGRANSIMIKVEVAGRYPRSPAPIGLTLALVPYVLELLVDVWEPDTATMDSPELLQAKNGWPEPTPGIGYVSWFADRIVQSDLSVQSGVTLTPYANGTMVSLDVSSPTLLEDGLALVEQIRSANLLSPLPDDSAAASTNT